MNLLALDIGGANLKAAVAAIDANGTVGRIAARSLPFALWREPRALPQRLAELVGQFPNRVGRSIDALAVTMTAELCDCFSSRREGVGRVLDRVKEFAAGRPVGVWLTDGRFVSMKEARKQWRACASANWHALATWLAARFDDGASLLIDVGSTTTDITPLRAGRVPACGNDASRLESGGLVYVGAFRTPLMAIPLQRHFGEPAPVIAERFATSADIFVLTGDQPEHRRGADTADGRPLTPRACANRVLRMVGHDLSTAGTRPVSVAEALAYQYRQGLEALIADGVGKVMSRVTDALSADMARGTVKRIIVAGSGEFIALRVAKQVLPGVPVVSVRKLLGQRASTAACAVALLHLVRGRWAVT